MSDDPRIDRQISYYRARAGEYDEWFLRRGRYNHGPQWNRRWRSEVEDVRSRLDRFEVGGKVLELACGTGWWTAELARRAESITAVDVSPETLKLNRERVADDRVRYVLADLFERRPDDRYDLVFFGFWLSHVPPGRFEDFWSLVSSSLAPDGRVFFVDSLRSETSTARNQLPGEPDDATTTRRLNDGREFEIFKVFYDPESLASRLESLGWSMTVKKTENYFLCGQGHPTPMPSRTPAP